MTGNTWDIIKIQTKTNQLMMGNRKDHIRVRGQRQRKTKSDTCDTLEFFRFSNWKKDFLIVCFHVIAYFRVI